MGRTRACPGEVRTSALGLIASPRSYSAWFGRITATSVAGGMQAVFSSTAVSSRSIFLLTVETVGSAQGGARMPAWVVSTIGEGATGGHAQFSTVGSWSYSGSFSVVIHTLLYNGKYQRGTT